MFCWWALIILNILEAGPSSVQAEQNWFCPRALLPQLQTGVLYTFSQLITLLMGLVLPQPGSRAWGWITARGDKCSHSPPLQTKLKLSSAAKGAAGSGKRCKPSSVKCSCVCAGFFFFPEHFRGLGLIKKTSCFDPTRCQNKELCCEGSCFLFSKVEINTQET